MAKFLKSIFQPTETPKSMCYNDNGSEEKIGEGSSAMDSRRKLSISRSGRMKQAQKKRLSLSLEIYGEEIDIQGPEKPKSVEYHVNQLTQSRENPLAAHNQRRRSRDSMSSTESGKVILRGTGNQVTVVPKVTVVASEIKTPEEEIDNAFEIITQDKS